MRIGFVHTEASQMELFRDEMTFGHPHIDCFHTLNEGLLQDLTRGEERSYIYRRAVQQIMLAADTLADLVVMTCSDTAPAVDIARQLCPVPIVKIDDPMSAEAVRLGGRIAVICTRSSTAGPAAALLRQHAAAQGREVLVETVVRVEAHTALFAGDQQRHDDIIIQSARDAATRADVILLSKPGMSHLQGQIATFGKPVLSAPKPLMAELARRLAPQRANV